MKFIVHIMPRAVVLDTQGRSVKFALEQQGFPVLSCRIGKRVEIDLPGSSYQELLPQVEKIAKEVLSNPLIEEFSIERGQEI